MAGKGVNQLDQRQINSWLIKRHLYLNSPISRVEIGRYLGLTNPVITGMMTPLIAAGIVQETGTKEADSKVAGRRRVLLEFNPDAFYICGVDLGPYHTNYVMTDFQGKIVAKKRTSRTIEEYDKTMDHLSRQIPDFIAQCGVPQEKLLGIGIGMPGLINGDEGKIYTTFKEGWTEHDAAAELGEILGKRVFVENNVRAKVIGAEIFDRMIDCEPFAYFAVSYGVACQMIVGEKVLYGDSAAAGEIGHMVVQRGGPVCPTCGNRGCLEALAGEWAVITRCREMMEADRSCCLWKFCNRPEELTMDMVLEAQVAGDCGVEDIVSDALDYLAIALANTVNLISPKAVAVDGRIFRLERNQDYFLRAAERNMFRVHTPRTKFTFLPYDMYRGARAAAAVVVKDYLYNG